MCVGISTPLKHPLLSCQAPLNLQTVHAPPFLGNRSPLYRFFMNSPLKVGFFSECPKLILFLTKFLVKISQFEFLFMTEKNVFLYKLFLSLNISDLSFFFFVKIANPPEESYPLFSSNPPLKQKVLLSLPF